MPAVARPRTIEMVTSTTWTVRNFVALPEASRARGSFMTRRRNCGHTTSDHTPATIRTQERPAGRSTVLVGFQPGLCLLGLDVQCLADHRLRWFGGLSAQGGGGTGNTSLVVPTR